MSKHIISKELISEVLGADAYSASKWIDNKIAYSTIMKTKDKMKDNFINIHELAHKCKEWAYDKGYDIGEEATRIEIYDRNECKIIHYETKLKPFNPENIFKASQWILDKIESEKK